MHVGLPNTTAQKSVGKGSLPGNNTEEERYPPINSGPFERPTCHSIVFNKMNIKI